MEIRGDVMKLKKKKSTVIILIILIILILLPIILYIIGKIYFSTNRIYELNWKIDLPSNTNVVYNYKSEISFRGEGYRYTVYETRNEFNFDEMFLDVDLKKIDKSNGDSASVDKEFVEKDAVDIINNMDIPELYLPPFEEPYMWTKLKKPYNDILFIVYFPQRTTLYLIEKLS